MLTLSFTYIFSFLHIIHTFGRTSLFLAGISTNGDNMAEHVRFIGLIEEVATSH
jgi:hypothetical protein